MVMGKERERWYCFIGVVVWIDVVDIGEFLRLEIGVGKRCFCFDSFCFKFFSYCNR